MFAIIVDTFFRALSLAYLMTFLKGYILLFPLVYYLILLTIVLVITKCNIGGDFGDVAVNLVMFVASSFGCSGIKVGKDDDDSDDENETGALNKVNLRLISKIVYSIVFIAFAIYFGMAIAPSLTLQTNSSIMAQKNHRCELLQKLSFNLLLKDQIMENVVLYV